MTTFPRVSSHFRAVQKPEQPRAAPSARTAAHRQGGYDTGAEEKLIQDHRAALRPSQMVEHKLSGMLKEAFVLVSQLRFKDMIRRGSQS
jgi:hypothetical protein